MDLSESHAHLLVVVPSGCWVWVGGTNGRYATVTIGGKKQYAHRTSYERKHGSIPDGLVIDHLCRQTRCVNPDHLEAVTQRTNVRRGAKGSMAECVRGHPFDADNTYVKSNGCRCCRTCHKMHRTRYRKEAAVGPC